MLTYIKIHGFKSFYQFEMELAPFTVITGEHGSGKSNLFDALHLLGRLAEVDLMTAFGEQKRHCRELFTQYSDSTYGLEMEFTVEILVDRKTKDDCGDNTTLKYTRLRYYLKIRRGYDSDGFDRLYIVNERLETIKPDDDNWVKKYIPRETSKHWIKTRNKKNTVTYIATDLSYTTIIVSERNELLVVGRKPRSIISLIDSIAFRHILAAKQEMLSWKFMRLNIEELHLPARQYTYRDVTSAITESGKNLPEVLFRIKQDDPCAIVAISRDLNNLLPSLVGVGVYYDEAKQEVVVEVESDDGRKFSLKAASEGALRLLALLVLQYDSQQTGTLFFENPENGIDPSLSGELGKLLKELSIDFENTEVPLRQVIVNTHCKTLVNGEDKNVAVFDFHNVSLSTTVKGKRVKLKVTTCAVIP